MCELIIRKWHQQGKQLKLDSLFKRHSPKPSTSTVPASPMHLSKLHYLILMRNILNPHYNHSWKEKKRKNNNHSKNKRNYLSPPYKVSVPLSLVQLGNFYYLHIIYVIYILILSHPLDVNYILEQGQGHGHLSKCLIPGLIFPFFSCLYEKKLQTLLYKKGLLIYLSSIKTELAINFLKKTFVLGWK